MSLSIFNFKENICELRAFIYSVRKRGGIALFTVTYGILLYLYFLRDMPNLVWLLVPVSLLVTLYMLFSNNRKSFIIILISGILFFAVGEVYFRIHYFGTKGITQWGAFTPKTAFSLMYQDAFDPTTLTGFKPNSAFYHKGGYLKTNSRGFVDEERTVEKGDRVIRIVSLGDSLTVGSGVDYGENYSCVLEHMLNTTVGSEQYEVITLARGGWGFPDYVHVLKTLGMNYQPDIILIGGILHKTIKRRPISFMRSLAESKMSRFEMIIQHPEFMWFFAQAIRNEFFVTVKSFIMPTHHVPPRLNEQMLAIKPLQPIDESSAQLLAIAGEVPVFFMNAEFWQLRNFSQYHIYVGDRHFTASGHAMIAETVYDALMSDIERIKIKRGL